MGPPPTRAPDPRHSIGGERRALWWASLWTGAALLTRASVGLGPLGGLALGAGLSMIKATGLISATGGGAIAGKLALAAVADRIDRIALFSALCLLVALVNIALLVSKSYAPLLASAAALGVALGAAPDRPAGGISAHCL